MGEPTAKPTGPEVIKAALKSLPLQPGVYLMKDARAKVVYVGKAKKLRSRVASYTRDGQGPSHYRAKVAAMVSKVASVEYVVTASEKEALLLESILIKRHRPRYNVDLRDDKNYPLFRLSLRHDYPRLSLVRRAAKDGARYFGPFEDTGAARRTLRLLQRIFPLRRCSDHALKNRSRHCLDYDTGRCLAPCTGRIGKQEYQTLVRQLEAFFSGQGQKVAADLERQMQRASREQQYEKAGLLRDRWQALTRTLQKQRVSKAGGGDMDVLALHQDQGYYRLGHLMVREGRVVGSRVSDLGQAALEPDEALGQALVALYDRQLPPPLVLLSAMPREPSLVVEVLAERAGRKVELRTPQRGEKRGLMDLAMLNARQASQAAGKDPAAILEGLARRLELDQAPAAMECMDISHLGGSLTVASVAAFWDGRPDKASYRRYKVMSTSGGADDYAAMAEVVARRLGGERAAPDLLLLDGGKGQLNAGLKALEDVPLERRPALAALAKGRGKGPDLVYLPGRKNPVNFKPHDQGLLMLMRIRDEAHRFAVSYHRLLRKKALTKSILEEVPGIGPRTAKKVLKAFGTLAALKKAGAAEISRKSGLNLELSGRIAALLAALDSTQPQQ